MLNKPLIPKAIEYNIDVFSSNSLKGWIFNKDNPQQKLAMLLLRNGEMLASGLVDVERPDVENVYQVPRSGFTLSFPDTDPRYLNLIAYPTDQSTITVPGSKFEQEIYDYDLLCDKRWRGLDKGDQGLTWGVILEGNSFFEEIQKHIDISQVSSIIEIGPGYGRLAQTLIKRKHPFSKFLGVDISPQKIEKLQDKIQDGRMEFTVGDCRTVDLKAYGKFDLVISSSTFEHIRPDFGVALAHIRQYMKPKGIFAFDLTDCGDDRDVQGLGNPLKPEGEFVGHYSRKHIKDIIAAAGLEMLAISSYAMQHEDFHDIIAENPDKPLFRDDCLTWLGDKEKVLLVHRYMVIARKARTK